MLFSDDDIVGTVEVSIKVSASDIETIIVSGFEGGCNYWLSLDNSYPEWDSKPKSEPSSIWATKILLSMNGGNGGTLYFFDAEEETEHTDEKWTLTLEKLLNGIKLNAIHRRWDCDLKNGDAQTADCIIQYAMFGEIVYS